MSAIPSVDYRSRSGQGLEVLDSDELFDRFTVENLAVHRRLAFHLLLDVRRGGLHDIDFEPIDLPTGAIVHLRPGQVHRWSPDGDRSIVVLFPDGPWAASLGGPAPSTPWTPDAGRLDGIRASFEHARSRLAEPADDGVVAALRELVIAEVADGVRPGHSGPAPYRALIARLDVGDLDRSVGHHARVLGYSERTLSRACLEAEGRTAKEVIDARVMLEAQRRLSDPQRSAASVGIELGFSEPTNFVKFFRRLVGATPAAWRSEVGLAG